MRVLLFSTISTETAYFHRQKALDSFFARSNIPFTGGAILQQEVSERGAIHEDLEEESGDPQGKTEEPDEGIKSGERATERRKIEPRELSQRV
jgi:hypothetical protein